MNFTPLETSSLKLPIFIGEMDHFLSYIFRTENKIVQRISVISALHFTLKT